MVARVVRHQGEAHPEDDLQRLGPRIAGTVKPFQCRGVDRATPLHHLAREIAQGGETRLDG